MIFLKKMLFVSTLQPNLKKYGHPNQLRKVDTVMRSTTKLSNFLASKGLEKFR